MSRFVLTPTVQNMEYLKKRIEELEWKIKKLEDVSGK